MYYGRNLFSMKLTDRNGKKILTGHPDLSNLPTPKNDLPSKEKFKGKPKKK